MQEDIHALTDLNADLKTKVNQSSVDAVNKANSERKQAIRDRDKGIKEAQSKAIHDTYEAHEKQREAEKVAKKSKELLERRSFLYCGMLFFTLFCQAIINPQVRTDFVDFFSVPAQALYDSFTSYISWLIELSTRMEIYWAWIIRIGLSALLILSLFLCGVGIAALYKKYKERWCTLSLKVLVGSIAVISVFGEPIRTVVHINLILLFLLAQIGYLGVLWYFDGYYANRYRQDDWKRIQND